MRRRLAPRAQQEQVQEQGREETGEARLDESWQRATSRVDHGEVEKEVEAPGQAEEEAAGRAVCFDPALNPEGAHGVARFTSDRAKKREKNIV